VPKTERYIASDEQALTARIDHEGSHVAGDGTVLSNLVLAHEVLIPAVVVGELFFGAAKSGRPPNRSAAEIWRFQVLSWLKSLRAVFFVFTSRAACSWSAELTTPEAFAGQKLAALHIKDALPSPVQ
jgi:predicted nucleic acid-binding protein